jgi:hypothetical protein
LTRRTSRATPRTVIRHLTFTRLIVAEVALHNLEEWLTFPRFGEVGTELLRSAGLGISPPPWGATQLALLFATIAPAAIVILAAARPGSPRWRGSRCGSRRRRA